MNARKYSYAKEILPLNEVIQVEPFEHAQLNKLWYAESPKCLPEGCTQLRAWQTLRPTPRETKKWGEVQRGRWRSSPQGRGWALQLSSQVRKHLRSEKRCKRTSIVPVFGLLVRTLFIPISAEKLGDKFAVQTLEGREIPVFHEEIFTPEV